MFYSKGTTGIVGVGFFLAVTCDFTNLPSMRGEAKIPVPWTQTDPLPLGAIARIGTAQKDRDNALRVAFLPDSQTAITIEPNRKVVFWEARTGKELRSLAGHFAVNISPDGKTMASRNGFTDESIRIYDLGTGKPICEIRGTRGFGNYCFMPDGRHLVVGNGENPPRMIRHFEYWKSPRVRRSSDSHFENPLIPWQFHATEKSLQLPIVLGLRRSLASGM